MIRSLSSLFHSSSMKVSWMRAAEKWDKKSRRRSHCPQPTCKSTKSMAWCHTLGQRSKWSPEVQASSQEESRSAKPCSRSILSSRNTSPTSTSNWWGRSEARAKSQRSTCRKGRLNGWNSSRSCRVRWTVSMNSTVIWLSHQAPSTLWKKKQTSLTLEVAIRVS